VSDSIVVGKVAGVYGVRGWVRVLSYTRPKENILDLSPWRIVLGGETVETSLLDGRLHGKGLVAQLDKCADRDQAMAWVGADIEVARSQLPAAGEDEYYWADLIGLQVVTTGGAVLGEVTDLMETGANDVLVVNGESEHLIPAVFDRYILRVDLEQGRIEVDWEPEGPAGGDG